MPEKNPKAKNLGLNERRCAPLLIESLIPFDQWVSATNPSPMDREAGQTIRRYLELKARGDPAAGASIEVTERRRRGHLDS